MFSLFKKKKKIVTHSGGFHADEIFACATLSLYLKKHNVPYRIIRTRDSKIIDSADYVVDVGGINNPDTNHFDHHQPGGAGKRDNEIPYASFGLVWKKFGPLLCEDYAIVAEIDRRIAQPIDAIDNGISLDKNRDCNGVYEYGLYGIISSYQNTWKEWRGGEARQQKSFMKLVDFFAGVLEREIVRTKHYLEMLDILEKAYQDAEDKRVVEVPHHVGIAEFVQALHKYEEVLYIIARSNVNWKVMAMRKDPCQFGNRKSLPAEWSGKRAEELSKITGVSDALFCHNACWMAVASSKEGAWKLAKIALADEA